MMIASHNELENQFWIRVLPTILKMADLAIENTHGHEEFFPSLSFKENLYFILKKKIAPIYFKTIKSLHDEWGLECRRKMVLEWLTFCERAHGVMKVN